MSLPSTQRPARARARAPWYCRALFAFTVAMVAALPPLPALALVQTTNERTPTWITFAHRVKSSAPGDAVYRGMALFCEFPEQFAPRTPNPRWAEERPWRLHFVERMNPAFSRCLIRVFATWPEFADPEIEAVLRLTFEKALPPKIGLVPVGDRQVEMKQFIVLAALSSHPSDSALRLLLQDGRFIKRAADLRHELGEEIAYLGSLTDGVWATRGGLCEMGGHEVQSETLTMAHASVSFMS